MKPAGLFGLILALASASASAAEDGVWRTTELGRVGDITVQLQVRASASLVDEEWLRLEFKHPGEDPVPVRRAQYRMNRVCHGLRTGRRTASGSLASGNIHDLFPLRRLEPGTNRAVAQPSDYSAAILGLPPKDGWLVKASIHLDIELGDGSRLSLPDEGVPFEFEWLYPDQAGFRAMRARLLALLKNPKSRPEHAHILGTLLGIAGVGDACRVEDLLAALDRREGSFDGRWALAEHLGAHHPDDEKVLAYYRTHLGNGDTEAVHDLLVAPGIWRNEFIEALLAIYEDGGLRDMGRVLRLLHQHRAQWPADSTIPQRLSAALLRKYEILEKKPDEIDADRFVYWASLARLLSLTGDPAVILVLRPFLDRQEPVLESDLVSLAVGVRFPPARVCDVALDAILTVLDGEPHTAYAQAGYKQEMSYGKDAAQKMAALRNKMIASLKTRLSKLDTDD